MSDESNTRPCNWPEGCEDEATKHLVYTSGPGRVLEGDHIGHAIEFQIRHADLCAEHLMQTREHYGGQERGLYEECPECPQRKGRREVRVSNEASPV
jgi:hypothetical protein